MHQARFLEVLFQKIIRKDNWQIPKEGIRIAALLLDQVCPAKQGRDFCSTAQLNEHPHCAVHGATSHHFAFWEDTTQDFIHLCHPPLLNKPFLKSEIQSVFVPCNVLGTFSRCIFFLLEMGQIRDT